MDRLYTAFVSSTFLDLREERSRLVRTLLDQRCVPLGMEFFPSVGRSQWPIIKESIESADFCIFIVAGRYGTISDDGKLSWTHREFRECVGAGKPIVALLHGAPASLAPGDCEKTKKGQASLAAFRRELEGQTVCRYYESEADMVQAATASIGSLVGDRLIEGWVRAGANPVVLQESDFDRVYQAVESHYALRRCEDDRQVWDAIYGGKRSVIGQEAVGLKTLAIDFSRDSDREVPDPRGLNPTVLLKGSERRNGFTKLAAPRKQGGSSFVQDAIFTPPLAQNEMVTLEIEASIPRFRYASRGDLMQATADSRLGPRTYDWLGRNVIFPTREMTLTVFLPDELGATPRGPVVMRTQATVDEDLTRAVTANGYSVDREERDGVPGYVMQLHLRSVRMRRRYRLMWDLPPEVDAWRAGTTR